MARNRNLSGGLFARKPTPLAIKETPLSAQIADWLDARGVYNDRLQCGRIQTPRGNWVHLCKAGTPDRFAIVRGQIIFIEVKAFGGKLSDEQKARIEELRQAGAVVLSFDSFERFTAQFTAIRAAIETREKELVE